jgi:hypothetical protein
MKYSRLMKCKVFFHHYTHTKRRDERRLKCANNNGWEISFSILFALNMKAGITKANV